MEFEKIYEELMDMLGALDLMFDDQLKKEDPCNYPPEMMDTVEQIIGLQEKELEILKADIQSKTTKLLIEALEAQHTQFKKMLCEMRFVTYFAG